MQVKNSTANVIEILLAGKIGRAGEASTFKIEPDGVFSVPIEAIYNGLIFMRPFGFGFDWSGQGLNWRDIHEETLVCVLRCESLSPGYPSFRFQLNSTLHSKER